MDISEVFKYIEKRSKELVKYSDTLRTAFKDIDAAFTPLFEDAGVRYRQKEPFYSEYSEPYGGTIEYCILIDRDSRGGWGLYYDVKNETGRGWIGDASRAMLKAAVSVFPEFIAKYAERLDKTTEAYKQASEMAAAMAEAVEKAREAVERGETPCITLSQIVEELKIPGLDAQQARQILREKIKDHEKGANWEWETQAEADEIKEILKAAIANGE